MRAGGCAFAALGQVLPFPQEASAAARGAMGGQVMLLLLLLLPPPPLMVEQACFSCYRHTKGVQGRPGLQMA